MKWGLSRDVDEVGAGDSKRVVKGSPRRQSIFISSR